MTKLLQDAIGKAQTLPETAQDVLAAHIIEKTLEFKEAQNEIKFDEEWIRRFREWVSAQKPLNGSVNDSRETIYEGR